MNFLMFKLILERRGTRHQITNIHWIIKKAREFQKNIYFWFIDYAKAFNCVDHNKLWKIGGWCMGMNQRDDMWWEVGGVSGLGTHVHPWLIYVNVW